MNEKVSGRVAIAFGAMDDLNETHGVVPPLRDRARGYVVVFLAGLGGSAGIGLMIGLVRGGSMWNASGYTVMLLGVVMLLVGGVAAGGHSHMSVGSMVEAFENRSDHDEESPVDESEAVQRPATMKDVENGFGAKPNPHAVWELVGGVLYIAAGIAIVTLGA